MKILIANTFHYMRGGDSRHAFGLARLLRSEGHEVIPFAMHHPQNVKSEFSRYFVTEIDYQQMLNNLGLIAGIRVFGRSIYSREAKQKIEKLIEETKPDLAHLQNIRYHLTPSIIFALKKKGIPIIWTLHDYDLLCPNSLFLSNGHICEKCKGFKYYNVVINRCKKGSLSASFMAAIESYAQRVLGVYALVDKFITPSAFLKNKLVEFGFDKTKIINIPNFIEIDTIKPHYDHKDYFLYFGRISEEKGLKVLIEAVKGIPNGKLLIVGEGPTRKELETYAGLVDSLNIHFLGFKTGNELKRIVEDAMFVVLPSIWYENFPYAILEAFASGKPVIASSIGGIPELIQNGVNGLLFEPGNAEDLREKILFLLTNRDIIGQLGKAAVETIRQEFNSSNHYEKTWEIYRKILSGGYHEDCNDRC